MNTQIVPLVEQEILQRMHRRDAFTALDISNALKSERYAVRHSEVAEVVRDVFQSGAMAFYDYDRRLIDVVADGGSRPTQAFLYLHQETRARDYDRRDQEALALVPADQARTVPADDAATAVLARPPRTSARPAVRPGRSQTGRRDGAFSIPRRLVVSLGWTVGMTLVWAADGRLDLRPPSSDETRSTVRVWQDHRVRICRRKLAQRGMQADRLTLDLLADGSLHLIAHS